MKTIKKLCVYHRRIVDGGNEMLAEYLRKQYHAARADVSNGEVHLEWFAGTYGDYKDVNVFKALFKSIITDKNAPMPSNWQEVAEHWILAGISIQQVEELLGCDMIEIPEEFFDYAYKVNADYEKYCIEHIEEL